VLPERDDPRQSEPGEVADLAAHRSVQDRHERRVLTDAIDAAVETFYDWAGEGRDLRLAVVAMYGDPYAGDPAAPEAGRSVPAEARFFSLTDREPLGEHLRRHLALETMRIASPALFAHVDRGLSFSNFIDELSDAAGAGDADADELLSTIARALATRHHELDLRRGKADGSSGSPK
jgi:hypothetical protein